MSTKIYYNGLRQEEMCLITELVKYISLFFQLVFSLLPPFLGIAQLTLGMNVSFFVCAAFIGCREQCVAPFQAHSILVSLPLYLSPVLSVVVHTVMVALVSHWHAPMTPMSVTSMSPFNNTLPL